MAVNVKDTEESQGVAKVLDTLIKGSYDTVHWKFHRERWGPIAGGICCGTMPTNNRENVDGILMTLNRQYTAQDTARRWWKHLLDPDHSPWKRVLKDVTLYETKDGRYDAFYMGIDETTGFRDAVNLFIALRQTYENYTHIPKVLAFWDEWQRDNCTVTFAEALAVYCFYRDGKLYDKPHVFNGGHGFLAWGGTSLVALAKRDPVRDTTTLRHSSDYRQSDTIWNNDAQRTLLTQFVTSKAPPKPAHTGVFATYRNSYDMFYGMGTQTTAPMKLDEVLKFIRESN